MSWNITVCILHNDGMIKIGEYVSLSCHDIGMNFKIKVITLEISSVTYIQDRLMEDKLVVPSIF